MEINNESIDDFNSIFSPILNSLEDPEGIIKPPVVKKEARVVNEDALNIENLLNLTESHILDDEKIRAKIDEVADTLSNLQDRMSIKELIDYFKALVHEREFHNKCIKDVYNFALKTEMSKKLLYNSNKEQTVIDVTERKKLNALVKLFKDTPNS